jgi:hypothetical protein
MFAGAVLAAGLCLALLATGCSLLGPAPTISLTSRVPTSTPDPDLTLEGSVEPSGTQVSARAGEGPWQAGEVTGTGFKVTVKLVEGDNQVTLRAGQDPKNETSAQKQVRVKYLPWTTIEWTSPSDKIEVEESRVTVSGKTLPGASATLNERPLDVQSDGTFSTVVEIPLGISVFEVVASAEGHSPGESSRSVTRVETAAAYQASCQLAPSKALMKNPDAYSGKRLRAVGKITNIMEQNGETTIQMDITRGSYGFWNDSIMVFYKGTTPFVQDDIVQVWGDCGGRYSYTSVAGWELTVPLIQAKYVAKSR